MFEKLSNMKFKGDAIIWMVFFFLCIISILEVYSASSSLTYKAGSYWKPVVYHTFLLLIGVGFMIVTMNIKCKYFKIVTPFALLLSVIMLIWVLFMARINDAARWINIFGIQFQPSELAKGAVVLAEAQILSAMQTIDGADRRAFKYIWIVSLPIILLIAMENLSTAALLFLTVFIMMFIGRVPKMQLGRTLGWLALLGVFAVAMVWMIGDEKDTAEKQDDKMVLAEEASEEKADPNAFAKAYDKVFTGKEINPEATMADVKDLNEKMTLLSQIDDDEVAKPVDGNYYQIRAYVSPYGRDSYFYLADDETVGEYLTADASAHEIMVGEPLAVLFHPSLCDGVAHQHSLGARGYLLVVLGIA